MVLNEEKRARLVDALARRQEAMSGVGASTPSTPIAAVQASLAPAPSAPIVAVRLAAVRASPAPAPLKKNKGVVEIDYWDEDSAEGPVFKRRRALTSSTPRVPHKQYAKRVRH